MTFKAFVYYRKCKERHLNKAVLYSILQVMQFFDMLVQFIAMGSMIQGVSNQQVPAWAGALLLGVVMLIYENLGGMQSVAWTDVLQGIILFAGFIFLLVI